MRAGSILASLTFAIQRNQQAHRWGITVGRVFGTGKRMFMRFRGHRFIGVLGTCYPTHRTDPLVWGNAVDLCEVTGFCLP